MTNLGHVLVSRKRRPLRAGVFVVIVNVEVWVIVVLIIYYIVIVKFVVKVVVNLRYVVEFGITITNIVATIVWICGCMRGQIKQHFF